MEICSACHPFYTGKKKLIDTTGRVERFQKLLAKKKPKVIKVKKVKEPKTEKVVEAKKPEVAKTAKEAVAEAKK